MLFLRCLADRSDIETPSFVQDMAESASEIVKGKCHSSFLLREKCLLLLVLHESERVPPSSTAACEGSTMKRSPIRLSSETDGMHKILHFGHAGSHSYQSELVENGKERAAKIPPRQL